MDNDIRRLLSLATHDPFLGPGILQKGLSNIQPVVYLDRTVGIVIPKQENDGRFRTGPIFIDPAFRSKGIARKFIKSFFENRPGRAWIDPLNKTSISAYTRAGFYCTGKTIHENGDTFYEYLIN